ncbi:MAG: hypothetical protein ACRDL7_15280, partial [Gaiellaceae bacterium]
MPANVHDIRGVAGARRLTCDVPNRGGRDAPGPCVRTAHLAICGTMNLRLLWDDLREIPVFMGMAGA